MALMLKDENLLPEAGEIRALYSQLEALLMVVEGIKKKKSPIFPASGHRTELPKTA